MFRSSQTKLESGVGEYESWFFELGGEHRSGDAVPAAGFAQPCPSAASRLGEAAAGDFTPSPRTDSDRFQQPAGQRDEGRGLSEAGLRGRRTPGQDLRAPAYP